MRRVVVTGLGAVTPVGNTVAETWENLLAGKHGIAPITKFDTTDYKATLAAEVKNFDPLLTMDRSFVRRNDPFCQYGVAASVEAMEDSNLAGNIDPERLGVYFSSGIGGLTSLCGEYTKLKEKGPRRASPYTITMMMPNDAAGEISIRHGAQGPSMGFTSACASSTHAIGEAYRAIAHGYADAILAGGAEATITEIASAGFANCMALATTTDADRASIPFDAERSGFVMGEGAACLVLEEYEHAVARGAKIYAELCGYGATSDAHHITAPDPEGIQGARAIKMAYDMSGITSDKIYVNAHGTSTPMNDKTETKALKRALGEELARRIVISSTKSMTGHMLGAAGATEAVVAVLALKNGVVPPTVGLTHADPECDLDYCPNVKREMDIDLALSTSLGFGGHNGCIAFKKVEG